MHFDVVWNRKDFVLVLVIEVLYSLLDLLKVICNTLLTGASLILTTFPLGLLHLLLNLLPLLKKLLILFLLLNQHRLVKFLLFSGQRLKPFTMDEWVVIPQSFGLPVEAALIHVLDEE